MVTALPEHLSETQSVVRDVAVALVKFEVQDAVGVGLERAIHYSLGRRPSHPYAYTWAIFGAYLDHFRFLKHSPSPLRFFSFNMITRIKSKATP